MSDTAVDLAEIREARTLCEGVVHHTPTLISSSLSEIVGGRVLVKAEHLQRTGSFKIRGAYTRIAKLPRDGGVVAASAGNHAQGVAWAAARVGVPARIVMPVYASLAKVEATRGYGAEVILAGERFEDALREARTMATETGATLVHAFDDPWVIAGQGTLGLELCEDAPDVDRVLVPVGGGGLLAGVAVALKAERPHVRVIGIRPAEIPQTIADGAAVARLGERTAPLIDRYCDDLVSVDDEAISEAIVLHLERMKQVVEGAGALPLAALLAGVVPADGTSVLVCSGGNIDPGQLIRVVRHGLAEAGRYLFVRVMLSDRPGRLQEVLALLASELVNVLSVVHHRTGPLPLGAVEVELTLETRDRADADEVVALLRDAGYDVRR